MNRAQTPTDESETPKLRGSERLARLDPRVLRNTGVRLFSSASDAPLARRPTDLVLLLLAILGVLVLSFFAPGPRASDTTVAKLISELPGLFGWFWEISYDLLIGWALFLLITALAAHARKRLLAAEVLAGALAYGLGALVGKAAGTDWGLSLKAIGASQPPAVYPAMRLAIATAVIVTASPHLARPLRYVGRWLVWIGAGACIALGVALPIGVAAGLMVGMGSAALVHLLVGSPGGRLSLEQVALALGELGIQASDLRYAPLERTGVSLVQGSSADGRSILAKIYGRDAWDGQFLTTTWSSLWHRGETPHLGGRVQQVEHEALVTLLAERAGVPVLPVLAAGTTSGDAVLVIDTAAGRSLVGLEPNEIDDRLMHGLWDALGQLHATGIAHGALDGYRLVVRPDGSPALGDFGAATIAAEGSTLLADRAQLLVTTALLVGHERAISVAAAAVGSDALAEVLPFLQPAALDRESRRAVREREWDLDDLRTLSAETAEVEAPALEQLRRVTWSSILRVVLIAFLAYMIISALADVGLQSLIEEFQKADGAWMWTALLLSPVVQVPQAFSTIGASAQPVGFGPVLMLQFGVQFISLAVPSSAARIALEVRFFQRNGVAAAGALAIGVIDSVSTFILQVLLILVITLSGLATLDLSGISIRSDGSGQSWLEKLLVLAVVLLVLAVILALAVPRFRAMARKARDAAKEKVSEGAAALRVLHSPKKLLMLFGGNLVAQIMLAVVLGLCLRAFGYHLSLTELILVNTLVSLFAGFMPVPGGMGVAEAGYTAGLAAFGIPHTVALSTAIAYRLVTYYLPPIWGGFAMRWMRQHSYL